MMLFPSAHPRTIAASADRHGASWRVFSCAAASLLLILVPTPAARAAQPGEPASPAAANPAANQQDAADETTPDDIFSLLPGAAELAVVLDDASAIRTTGLGDSALALLDPDGLLGPIRKAWPELAAQLGYTSDEAFDALLGTRVVLITAGNTRPGGGQSPAADGGGTWALLSRVTPDAERRLMTRLDAAPRGLFEGHQILALPGGKFIYTVHHPRRPGGIRITFSTGDEAETPEPPKPTRDDRWVVIGPTERGGSWLMYSVVACLHADERGVEPPTPPLAVTAKAAIDRLDNAGGKDAPIRLVLRLGQQAAGEEHKGPGREWRDFLAVAARSEALRPSEGPGTRWRLDAVLREQRRAGMLAAMPWVSDAPLRRMLAYAPLAAVLQTSTTGGDAAVGEQTAGAAGSIAGSAGTVATVLASVGLDPGAVAALHGRQALLVEATGPSVPSVPPLPVERAQTADAGQPADGQPSKPTQMPAVTLAIELRPQAAESGSAEMGRFVAAMDTAVARLAGTLEQQLGGGSDHPPRDFGGVFPEAPRVLPLAFKPASPLFELFQRSPVLCWSYPGVGTDAAEAEQEARERMWWAITVAPGQVDGGEVGIASRTPAAYHRRAIDALAPPVPAPPPKADERLDRWLSLGVVQAAAVQAMLPVEVSQVNGAEASWSTAFRRIRLLEWRTRATDEGDVVGEIGIVLNDPPRAADEGESGR